jgi:hypothetical protein
MLSLQQISKRSANAGFTIKNFAYGARISNEAPSSCYCIFRKPYRMKELCRSQGLPDMSRFKKALGKTNFQVIVSTIFLLTLVFSGIGSGILALEYVSVYDTANRFNPQVRQILKEAPDSTTRVISIRVPVINNGSRLIHIEGYAFIVTLNGETVALRETFEDIFVAPGQRADVWGNFTFYDTEADPILEAEISGEWNWVIRYPMRVYVGSRLYVLYQHFIMPFQGVEEVS